MTRRRAAIAAAAAAVVLAALWLPRSGGRPAPFFRPAPLARLYHEAVRQGFLPYYECHDPKRFADAFAKRQGTPLRLLPMPEGTRMLGLSYPGGVSRDTTAMLCVVEGEPVMVFVDRAAADTDIELATRVADARVNVFRESRDGLVFYEVSPFDAPRLTELLAIAESPTAVD